MENKLQIPEALKTTIDFSVFVSVATAWAIVLTPLLQVGVILLAIIWGYFRVKDIRLAIKLKKLKLREYENLK